MIDYDKRAALATKHALMVTKWTCKTCAKANTLMMLKPEDWEKPHNVMCSNCHKMSVVTHRNKIVIRT